MSSKKNEAQFRSLLLSATGSPDADEEDLSSLESEPDGSEPDEEDQVRNKLPISCLAPVGMARDFNVRR